MSYLQQGKRWKVLHSHQAATLASLTDLEKRPPFHRQELSQEVLRTEAIQFELDKLEFLTCWRKADEVQHQVRRA